MTTVAFANIVDGETFALTDADGSSCVFVFQKTTTYTDRGYGGPRHPVNISAAVTDDNVRDVVITAVNECAHVQITASSGGTATVTLTQDRYGAAGNTKTAESVANGTFALGNFASGALPGVDIKPLRFDRPTSLPSDKMVVILRSTAGSGTMTVTARLWGFRADVGTWVPIGSSATADNRGVINLASAIAETTAPADQLRYADVVDAMWAFERAYLEITAIGGTATAVSAWLARG